MKNTRASKRHSPQSECTSLPSSDRTELREVIIMSMQHSRDRHSHKLKVRYLVQSFTDSGVYPRHLITSLDVTHLKLFIASVATNLS